MDWIISKFRKPNNFQAVDVTLLDTSGGRLLNIAIYRELEDTWELLIDKHNYQGCKVIAWKERPAVFEGKV